MNTPSRCTNLRIVRRCGPMPGTSKYPAQLIIQQQTTRIIPRGFTLIELMIVVAIVGILAAIAVPAYLRYTVRSQISEGITVAGGAKTAVTEYFHQYGTFPADNSTAALAPALGISGNYVTSVSVADEVISITYGNDASPAIFGEVVTLTAADSTGSVTWSCASAGVIQDRYLPSSCK